MNRLSIALKAVRQLGLQQVGLYAGYKFGLISGHYQRVTSKITRSDRAGTINTSLFAFPARDELLNVLGKDGQATLLSEAEEIVGGKARLFGAQAVPLQLSITEPLHDWTAYETGKIPLEFNASPIADVKFLWEPARFGWAFTLGRAFHLTGDERYVETFWRNFEIFEAANPPCLGPHWMSGQEVALRLMAITWAGQAFEGASASSPERRQKLAASVAAHAARIPPTLVYARSQHNNHLLTEAAGLLTAGLALREHPQASRWRELGWRWLNNGLQSQIDSYGEYAQHSTNYHRLMLQVVLWTDALARRFDLRWPRPTMEAIRRSVHWYLSMLDLDSGQVPNLGANDGACIFPLTVLPFADHRGVAGAAARAFLEYNLPAGPWDEMASLVWGRQAQIKIGRPAALLGRSSLRKNLLGLFSYCPVQLAPLPCRSTSPRPLVAWIEHCQGCRDLSLQHPSAVEQLAGHRIRSQHGDRERRRPNATRRAFPVPGLGKRLPEAPPSRWGDRAATGQGPLLGAQLQAHAYCIHTGTGSLAGDRRNPA